MSDPGYRSGLVALAGRPNVGKSTLVNRLVGEHVVAVSARPQTTRRRALGVVNREGRQLVMVDLPGFQKPFDRLTERLREAESRLDGKGRVMLRYSGTEPKARLLLEGPNADELQTLADGIVEELTKNLGP